MIKLITVTSAESLPRARHCVKNPAWVISFKSLNNCKRCEDLLLASFLQIELIRLREGK